MDVSLIDPGIWIPALHRLGRCDPLPCGPSSLDLKLYTDTHTAQLEPNKTDNLESSILAYRRTFAWIVPLKALF